MLDIFRKLNAKNLRAFVIWLPVRKTDNLLAAQTHKSEDPRINEFWNEDLSVDKAFMETLRLKRTAFDVYLIYGPDSTWSATFPPKPQFWMHQRSAKAGADQALQLDANRLKEAIKRSLTKG